MKKVIIGDLHGLDTWKRVVDKEGPDARYIFLGDYVDSYDVPLESQVTNLLEVLQFKKENPDNVVLILGNHDFHYVNTSCRYSGWSLDTYTKVNPVFKENLKLFEVVHREPEAVYAHAGLTNDWLRYFEVPEEMLCGPLTDERCAAYTETNSRLSYEYRGILGKLQFNNITGWSPYGDQTSSSPIWVRPNSLLADHHGAQTQVVGHTHVYHIHPETAPDGFTVWLCDALRNGEYLTYDNNQFNINTF